MPQRGGGLKKIKLRGKFGRAALFWRQAADQFLDGAEEVLAGVGFGEEAVGRGWDVGEEFFSDCAAEEDGAALGVEALVFGDEFEAVDRVHEIVGDEEAGEFAGTEALEGFEGVVEDGGFIALEFEEMARHFTQGGFIVHDKNAQCAPAFHAINEGITRHYGGFEWGLTISKFGWPRDESRFRAGRAGRGTAKAGFSGIDRPCPDARMRPMKYIAAIAALALCWSVMAENETPVQDIPLKDINGKTTSLKAYDGKVVLLVNVASRCGLTPQYEGLQAIHQKYKEQGFTVIGVPCNDFGAQEPGTNEEIKQFCSSKYSVTFPLMDKIHVKGPEQHPLYARLTGEGAAFTGEIEWNFGKFLIGRDGKIMKRFSPRTTPESPEVTAAIEAALKK